jgi:hypothetical protein
MVPVHLTFEVLKNLWRFQVLLTILLARRLYRDILTPTRRLPALLTSWEVGGALVSVK